MAFVLELDGATSTQRLLERAQRIDDKLEHIQRRLCDYPKQIQPVTCLWWWLHAHNRHMTHTARGVGSTIVHLPRRLFRRSSMEQRRTGVSPFLPWPTAKACSPTHHTQVLRSLEVDGALCTIEAARSIEEVVASACSVYEDSMRQGPEL